MRAKRFEFLHSDAMNESDFFIPLKQANIITSLEQYWYNFFDSDGHLSETWTEKQQQLVAKKPGTFHNSFFIFNARMDKYFYAKQYLRKLSFTCVTMYIVHILETYLSSFKFWTTSLCTVPWTRIFQLIKSYFFSEYIYIF